MSSVARPMKPSGVDWIGDIPSHWVSTKVGRYFRSSLGKMLTSVPDSPTASLRPYLCAMNLQEGYFDLSTVKEMYFSDYEKARYAIQKGDLLVVEGGQCGLCLIWEGAIGECFIQNALHRVKPVEKMSTKFLFYWLWFVRQSGYIDLICNKATIAHFTKEKLENTPFCFPTLAEQQAIADYLDEKCAEIDGLVGDIEKQIDILERYKQSVISEAVTKGLDPTAPMKSSGVDWFGDIPALWEIEKLKWHLKRNEPRNLGDGTVLSLYREYGVIPKDSRTDNYNVTSEDTSNYKSVSPGNFVVNKMKAWQGSVAVSQYTGIVSPAYYVYKFSGDTLFGRYFHYLIRNCYKDEFMRLSAGIRVGQWDLPASALENTPILIPKYEEQQAIADYLDKKCAEIDTLIATKQEQLEKLAEYKKSLIYEYVTGKKVVK